VSVTFAGGDALGDALVRPGVPLENRVTWPDLGLRGVVIFVDHSHDDGFSAYRLQVRHITDRLRLDVRGPLEPVGAENLCHQAIFMNFAPCAVTPLDPELIPVCNAVG
jgi:hypothetical protein